MRLVTMWLAMRLGAMRLAILPVALLVLVAGLPADTAQKLWPTDAPLVGMVRNLYRLCGLAGPSSAGPWTTAELRDMSHYVLEHGPRADPGILRLYNAIMTGLAGTPRLAVSDQAGLDWSLDYSFETYLHTNTQDFTREQDWIHGWSDRKPILNIPLRFAALDHFSADLDLSIMLRYLDNPLDPVGLYSSAFWTNNSLSDFFQLDFTWPYRAVGVVGGNHWYFQYGRDRLSWGPGRTGNLLVSDHLPFHEHLLFKSYFDTFSFVTACIFFPPPRETATGQATVKAFIAHRVEFNPAPFIQLALTESIMYQDQGLDIRYLNPLMIYHQYFTPGITNSLVTAELRLAPRRGMALYGQFAIDDLSILGEPPSIPNALAWQIGAEYLLLTSPGTLLVWLEHVHTDPMLYRRDGVDFIVSWKALYPYGGLEYIQEYLGYPSGGDSKVYALGLDWDNLQGSTAAFSLRYLVRGATGFDAAYPPADPAATTPTGIPERTLSIQLSGSHDLALPRQLPVGRGLALHAGISYITISNRYNSSQPPAADLQVHAGLTCKF
jgi:hypothetical protein